MTIALTGVTGAIGSLVLPKLGGSPILIGRDRAKLPAGHIGRQAAYGDSAAMTTALDGVDTLFFVSGRESATRLDEHLIVVEAAKSAGVERIVYLSFLGAAADATFTLARHHFFTEQAIRNSGMKYTFLRDSLYQDSLPMMAGADGVIRGPAGNGRLSAVARDDVAEVVVAVLAAPLAHDGRSYDITGPEALTLAEFAAGIALASGRSVSFQNESEEDAYLSRAKFNAPPFEVEGWVTSYQSIAAGELSTVSGDVEAIIGRKPVTFAAFLAAHPESYSHIAGVA